ncbi:ATP-binding protein [Chitinimonas sp. BJB300]|uniref:ATP-binding protein n=1 Tax=Chitinimonas sp. BJB300 TaxID=1559339 RepID=UPI001642B281|nr:ATP-binding protein [Chitinimonas sp. BJB300]
MAKDKQIEAPSLGNPSRLPQSPNLAGAQRVLLILISLTVLLPTSFFDYLLFSSYHVARDAAHNRVNNFVDVIQEHALKTTETNQQVLGRILDLIGQRSEADLRTNERELHRRFSGYVRGIPQLIGIGVIAKDGQLIASSNTYPVPGNFSIADREDFKAVQSGKPMYVSGVMTGRLNRQSMFNVSVPYHDAEGQFAGAVLVSLKPSYFIEYYSGLVATYPGVSLKLTQEEGRVLANVPNPAYPSPGAGKVRGNEIPQCTGKDSTTSDCFKRFTSLRKVPGYPFYVSASYPSAVWKHNWYRYIAILGAFTFIPTLFLAGTLYVVRRRLRSEDEVWRRWRAEISAREAIEAAFKQTGRLEALGQLTGGVAHDFNNLLMVIATSAMVLRKRISDPGLVSTLETLERVVESGRRLTRQLLAFARKQPLRPEVIHFEERMRGFTELLQASVGGRVSLKVVLEPNLARIKVDGSELELALLNLTLNARDALPNGGELTITASNVTLTDDQPDIKLTGRFVCISVSDNGLGIAEEDKERIFEPFFTTKPIGSGAGLGLAQVYGFCRQSGGLITVESELDAGTRVTMFLPVTDAEITPADPAQIIEQPIGKAGKALLVEDNPDVARSSQTLLEHLGYTVDVVPAGKDALLAVTRSKHKWDVVVSDVMMPGELDGIGLALELQKCRPNLPVLLVTGYAAKLEEAQQAGLHVLAKPYNTAMLARALKELYESHQQHAAI